jgi:hypothetical protein
VVAYFNMSKLRSESMSFNAVVLRVLIASPSDVLKERNEIENAIFQWNTRYAEDFNTILLPSRWENDVTPTYNGSDTQEVINEQLVNKCDILIGVFWSKLGTPTRKHSSGTLEEIDIFVSSGKEVMLYFINKDLPMNTDFKEFNRVRDFKNEYAEKGIYATYQKENIINHLYSKVARHKKGEMLMQSSKNSISGFPPDINIEQLILTGTLTKRELLLLKFTLDTGIRNFGVRWMEDNTIHFIKKWEEDLFTRELADNYNEVIKNLHERSILIESEHTSHGNVRLYTMPLRIYDDLRFLSNKAKEKLNYSVDPFYELHN